MWPGTKSNKQVVNRNRFVSLCCFDFLCLFVSRFPLYYVRILYAFFTLFICLNFRFSVLFGFFFVSFLFFSFLFFSSTYALCTRKLDCETNTQH